ncbi:MAG: zinc ribbon domain-containing protein [candidate division Zixibacteria bacterium]|nr:zinc ribbon domain-containing protein [candidate division Zixibacteria bacterium]
MPTYEYKCRKCQHEFEEFQSISAEPVKVCPSCKGEVERIISGGAGLIFKGSGFYITDYKRAGEKRPTEKSESKSDSKKESKESSSSSTSTTPSKKSSDGSSSKSKTGD